MTRPLVAVANIARLTVGGRIVLGTGIAQALITFSGVFKDPIPALADLQAATQELIEAADEAATNSKAGRGRLKKAKKAFDALVRQYVVYVNQRAQGDAQIIGQSGLSASREARRAEALGAPTGLQLKGNNVGEVQVVLTALPDARAYVWQYYVGATAPPNEADWQYLTGTTQGRRMITDLPSAQRVWVRVAAIGTRGQSPWSAPVSRVVL